MTAIWVRRSMVAAGLAALAVGPLAATASAAPANHRSGDRSDILIADQFNNRIIEVDRGHHVLWHFGDGSYVAGPHSVVGPNDAERIGFGLTLIAGTGTPGNGTDPSCPVVAGCPDNRVMLVSRHGNIVWQYGKAGVSGAGANELNTPVQATFLPTGNILVTDQANERVIEVTLEHKIVWQYGMTGVTGAGADQLNNPNSAELLPNGHILIADENNNRVIEVTRNHKIVWQYGAPTSSLVSGTAFASRLPNGNTLITSSNDNRIVEVTHGKKVVLDYNTAARPGSFSAPLPTRAVRLRNGDTLISDQFNDQVIEINPARQIVFTQGVIDTTNGPDTTGFNKLNAPYDAKVIGDFTGLTPPAIPDRLASIAAG
ncbi:MAG TPA: hypothetical protein VNW94_10975 [Streptosporangiaceae bacterium]|nr:hypothetical protein [Streptosporangiaceae bacterium]